MNFKKIVIATLVGSIGIAVLSLSLSFAWYNTSENLYVDTLVISVSGEQQLLISTTGEDGSFVTDLKYEIAGDDNSLEDAGLFQPVSSMFKSKWLEDDSKTEPEMYLYSNSAVDGDYAPHEDRASWGYYSQHFYLYCAGNVNATIDTEDFILNEIERLNSLYAYDLMLDKHVMNEYIDKGYDTSKQEDIDAIHDDLLVKLNSLKKCMRVGLYDVSNEKFYIIDPYKNDDTLLGGRADLFANRYYDYHREGDEYYETIYGEVSGRDKAVYKNTRDADTEAPETYTSFTSRTKEGVHAFDLEASLQNGLEIKKEESLKLEEVEENLLIPIKSGQPKEIVLMVYMEGWDLDCTNQHMGGSFNVGLKFKISEEKQ